MFISQPHAMPDFTTEDLLLYLYDEMNADQSHQLQTALETDWALKQKYLVLQEATGSLNNTKVLSPRSQTINSILKYAENSLHLSN